MRAARQLAALLLTGLLAGVLPSAALSGTGRPYMTKLRFDAASGRAYDLVAVTRGAAPHGRLVVEVRSRGRDAQASLKLRRDPSVLRLPPAAGPVTVLVRARETASSVRVYLKQAMPAKSALARAAVIGAVAVGAAGIGGDAVGGDPFTTLGVGSEGGPTAADPSGIPMPVGDLPGWRQVFSDAFTTNVPVGGFSGCRWNTNLMNSDCSGLPPAVAAKWWAYPDGWPDTTHHGQYHPSQVLSIHHGELDIYLHTANGIHMVAAPVPKIPGGVNGFGRQYGAYVVRFKADPVPGYKTAWLLWPDSDAWPADGEIDFPEGDLDSTMSGFMHRMGATSGSQQDAYPTSATYSQWHTATIEWIPGMARFILDGKIVGTSTHYVPSDPMHWVLQTETATDGTTPTDSAAGHVLIAWAAAYAHT